MGKRLLGGVCALALTGILGAHAAAAAPIAPPGAAISPALAGEPVHFEVFLPLRDEAGLDALLADQQNKTSPNYHKWLTPKQFADRFGPTPASVAKVTSALQAQGLTVTATHSRSVSVSGTAATVASAFGVALEHVQAGAGPSRLVAASPLTLPAALQAEGAVIVHFTGLPAHHVDSQRASGPVPTNRYSAFGPYWFDDLKQAYDYPSYTAKVNGQVLDGTGVNVAVLMADDVLDSDIQKAFSHEKYQKITGKPAPKINRLPINGGGPFGGGGSLEASLDVQMVLGGAPGANVTLVSLPDLSDENVIDGYLTIVESNAFDVVNSSFGGCELFYLAKYNGGTDYRGVLYTYETLFKQGNSQGITFVASSGDSGGLGCPDPSYFSGDPNAKPKFVAGVEWPADSPSVTAVGGTNLKTTAPPDPQTKPPTLKSAYVGENADGDPEVPYDPYGVGVNVSGGYWAAGGGLSLIFNQPSYQAGIVGQSTHRAVPDVGMQVGGCPAGISADPCDEPNGPQRSAVAVYFGGTPVGLIGTSVASPEFVSAAALFIEASGQRLGNLNTYLYSLGQSQTQTGGLASVYHRNISGFDGKYTQADPNGPAYDYLVGNGTPKVRSLFLMQAAPAGVPQTPSNP